MDSQIIGYGLIIALFSLLLIMIYFRFVYRPKKHVEFVESLGEEPFYAEVVSGKIGYTKYKGILVVALFENFMLLGTGLVTYKPIIVQYSDITSIEYNSGLIDSGIVVHHKMETLPKKVILKPRGNSQIMQILNEKIAVS